MDDLRRLIRRHASEGVTSTAIPGLYVASSESPTVPLGHILRSSMAMTLGGAKTARLNELVLCYGAGEYLIIGVDLPIVAGITDASPENPYLGVGIDLDPEAIAALLHDVPSASQARGMPPLGLAVSQAGSDLLEAVTRLVGLLDEPSHAAALASVYEREVLWRLLTGPQGALVRQIGLADGRLAHVARAIRFIRDHFAEPLRIDQLAELTAMSPSTLHRHFRAVTDMTPIQFQKQVRLQEARSRLLTHPGDVAGAGFAVGYESASQFNREYRRMFGAPPGRDSQARRTAALPA